MRAAVESVLEHGWSFGAIASDESEVARLLCTRFESMDLVRFTSSGTEANLVALALAQKSFGRSKILAFDGGYHGGFLSFSRDGASLNIPLDAVICDYNSLESVRTAFEQWPEQIAGVVVEPMLGSGGRIQATAEFLGGLRSLCDEHGSVLVFDEVQTSRMAYGGGQSRFGVRPDLTTLGKYIGGGFGFGAVGGSHQLMGLLERSSEPYYDHSGTFNNNRFAMAASCAMLRTVLTPENLTALFERGEDLRQRADTLLRGHGFQATGWGSLMGIHATDAPISCAADLAGTDSRRIRFLFHEMLERGVFIGKSGFVSLSLPQTPQTDEQFLAVLDRSMDVISGHGL